jgi:hypothetical protein
MRRLRRTLLAFFIEIGVAASYTHYDVEGRDPLAVGRIGYETQDRRWRIEYEHQSSILDGKPVNDNKDHRSQERLGGFYRFEFK